jgi:DNA-binding response OmpR family regulator
MKVLLAEDDRSLRSLIVDTLTRDFPSVTVLQALDRRGAVTFAEQQHPDAIIVDLESSMGEATSLMLALRFASPESRLISIFIPPSVPATQAVVSQAEFVTSALRQILGSA